MAAWPRHASHPSWRCQARANRLPCTNRSLGRGGGPPRRTSQPNASPYQRLKFVAYRSLKFTIVAGWGGGLLGAFLTFVALRWPRVCSTLDMRPWPFAPVRPLCSATFPFPPHQPYRFRCTPGHVPPVLFPRHARPPAPTRDRPGCRRRGLRAPFTSPPPPPPRPARLPSAFRHECLSGTPFR